MFRVAITFLLLFAPQVAAQDVVEAVWSHASATSAVVCFRLVDRAAVATSRVEFGRTRRYGEVTATSAEPRWLQFHRLRGLRPGTTYHFRPVVVTVHGKEAHGARCELTTKGASEAIELPGAATGPPFVLDAEGATYRLTEDVTAPGTAFELRAPSVTLDLDGHAVIFGQRDPGQVFGVRVASEGPALVCNGTIVQGDAAGPYSAAVETRWRTLPIEVFGIDTDVHRPCAYPLRLFGRSAHAHIHHNHLRSRVTEIESRHYPGNDLLRLDGVVEDLDVHDNLLTGGCHVGIRLSGGKDTTGRKVAVHHNDIRHHARYVNGYALAVSCPGARVHDNVITSTGRGVHLTAAAIELFDNRLDLRGHMTLDDRPQGSRPWQGRRVELHGIKLEGDRVRRCRVYRNHVRAVQTLPDEEWDYVPVTPLNIACYHKDARNEVFDNTFIALTGYRKTRHGPYGDAGRWAAALYFVGMDRGPAPEGGYAVWIHDNTFVSNDLLAAGRARDMTIRIEGNRFVLASEPAPTEGRRDFRGLGEDLLRVIADGGNALPERRD